MAGIMYAAASVLRECQFTFSETGPRPHPQDVDSVLFPDANNFLKL